MNIRKYIFNAWKQDDMQEMVIKLQSKTIYILISICLMLGLGWMHSPSNMTVYTPPDLSNGITQKVKSIPKAYIASFAAELWQEINYWQSDSGNEYSQNIHNYWAYLSPTFRTELLQESDDLKTAGQLQRQRMMQFQSNTSDETALVKQLSADSWEVDITMRITEIKNNQVIKN